MSHTWQSSYFKIFPGEWSVTNQASVYSYQLSIIPRVIDNFHSNSSLWENIGFIGQFVPYMIVVPYVMNFRSQFCRYEKIMHFHKLMIPYWSHKWFSEVILSSLKQVLLYFFYYSRSSPMLGGNLSDGTFLGSFQLSPFQYVSFIILCTLLK